MPGHQGPWSPISKAHMLFPFCDSSSPMDLPLYQQLQLSPASPKPPPDQSTTTTFYCYPCSPPFAAAADASFHLSYQIGSAAAAAATTPPQAVINSPDLPVQPLMAEQQAPAPATELMGASGVSASLDRAAAAAARKDRHSKIRTAGGMRDRRMRLSLDVAREFFRLQDLLGFDKASKTVRWLFHAARHAIREVMANDVDASSECVEDGSSSLSVVDPAAAELMLGGGGGGGQNQKPGKGNNNGGRGGEGKKPAAAKSRKAAAATPKPARKSGSNAHPVPDKETRAKARERARERTKEKHHMRWVKLASAIDVEAAAGDASVASDRPSSNNNHLSLSHHSSSSSSMNMPRAAAAAAAAAAEMEERERRSSALNNNNNRGRMQEITGSSDVVLGFGNGGYGGGGYYCQEQWELGGVVFQQNPRFY